MKQVMERIARREERSDEAARPNYKAVHKKAEIVGIFATFAA
jgi:hypothetical protein